MNPRYGYGTSSDEGRTMPQDRSDPTSSSRLSLLADLQAALTMGRGGQSARQLLGQVPGPLPATLQVQQSLPAVDIAALQQRMIIEENNRRRMGLQAQLDLHALSNLSGNKSQQLYSQLYTGPMTTTTPKTSKPTLSFGNQKQQQKSFSQTSPATKRRKLGSAQWLGPGSEEEWNSSGERKQKSRTNNNSTDGGKFPLPPLRDDEKKCMVNLRLAAFRPAWNTLTQKSTKLEGGLTREERLFFVKEGFGKAIQFDRMLLYTLKPPQAQTNVPSWR